MLTEFLVSCAAGIRCAVFEGAAIFRLKTKASQQARSGVGVRVLNVGRLGAAS